MKTRHSCMTVWDKLIALLTVHHPEATPDQIEAMARKVPGFRPTDQRGAIDTSLNWLLAGVLAIGLSSAWLLDGPSELQALADTASNTRQAQREAGHQARFVKAARRACGGDSAAYLLLADNSIRCSASGGYRTVKVAL